jgi:TPP-dependent pyruvate/acetoin dehydrogenase alpha subunit
MAAAGLAFVVAVAGLVFWNVPGQGASPAPDFIEATQFAFTQFLP